MASIRTAHFGYAAWVKGRYGMGEWHYAPFSATQRHLACGKLTPDARDVQPLNEVPNEPICSVCLGIVKEDQNKRSKKRTAKTVEVTVCLDGSHNLGYLSREDGKYGSHPAYDAMDDEAKA